VITLIAKLTAQPGKRAELIEALRPVIKGTEAEEGTLTYVLFEEPKDEDVLWFHEEYTDDAALAAHGSGEAMKAAGPAFATLLAGRPELHILTRIVGKGD
jgi:quinol monooxygenase YgiN